VEIVNNVFYFLYLGIIIGGGLLAVLSQSLVRAFVGLVSVMFGVAGMYFLINTPFVAFMQILIYVGAISILIFFAIMLAKPPAGSEEQKRKNWGKILLAVLMGLVPTVFVVVAGVMKIKPTNILPRKIEVVELGGALLGRYGLAFELISVVLFVAMAGAVVLAFEEKSK